MLRKLNCGQMLHHSAVREIERLWGKGKDGGTRWRVLKGLGDRLSVVDGRKGAVCWD